METKNGIVVGTTDNNMDGYFIMERFLKDDTVFSEEEKERQALKEKYEKKYAMKFD